MHNMIFMKRWMNQQMAEEAVEHANSTVGQFNLAALAKQSRNTLYKISILLQLPWKDSLAGMGGMTEYGWTRTR